MVLSTGTVRGGVAGLEFRLLHTTAMEGRVLVRCSFGGSGGGGGGAGLRRVIDAGHEEMKTNETVVNSRG